MSGNFIFSSFLVRFRRGFRERVGLGARVTGKILTLKNTQRVVMETRNPWFQARFYQKKHRSRFGSYLLCHFSTYFNEIRQDWPLWVSECSGGARIKKFQNGCHGNLKCGLWGPILPGKHVIMPEGSLTFTLILVHNNYSYHGISKFALVSMETVKLLGIDTETRPGWRHVKGQVEIIL